MRSEIVKSGSLHGDQILPFITPPVGEIDTESDFGYVEYLMRDSSIIYDWLEEHYGKHEV